MKKILIKIMDKDKSRFPHLIKMLNPDKKTPNELLDDYLGYTKEKNEKFNDFYDFFRKNKKALKILLDITGTFDLLYFGLSELRRGAKKELEQRKYNE